MQAILDLRPNLELTDEQFEQICQRNPDLKFERTAGGKLVIVALTGGNTGRRNLKRWQQLTPAQQQRIIPLCPDFVVELRSPSDDIEDLRTKMQEYLDNGLQLGWLLDPETHTVEIYRANQAVETLNAPETLSGEDILPGFVLSLTGIL